MFQDSEFFCWRGKDSIPPFLLTTQNEEHHSMWPFTCFIYFNFVLAKYIYRQCTTVPLYCIKSEYNYSLTRSSQFACIISSCFHSKVDIPLLGMAAILHFIVKMMSYHHNNARFRILMVNLAEMVSLHMIMEALVKSLIFQDGHHWQPFWIRGRL